MTTKLAIITNSLLQWDNEYYNTGKTTISDGAYDDLCELYEAHTGTSWNRDRVPGTASIEFRAYKHTFPIKSLAKVNTMEDCKKEIARLSPVVIQPKFDGITLVIYPDGKMVTRADGNTGEDITDTAVFLRRQVHQFPIRGEVVLPRTKLEEINNIRVSQREEPYKNCRNAVSGMLRNLNAPEYRRHLVFIAYNLMGSELSEEIQVNTLEGMGYTVPEMEIFSKVDNAWSSVEEFGETRKTLDYDTDGVVIKSNIPNAINTMGETGHHFKNAVAFKYQAEGKWTTLENIEWSTGRTGKVVPTAIISPVDILGSTIERCSLHTASHVHNMDLGSGDMVYVVKHNDVIPGIEGVISKSECKFLIPYTCPSCGESLQRVDSTDVEDSWQLYCNNDFCNEKEIARLVNMVKKTNLNIEGLSEETCRKLIELSIIDYAEDIFAVSVEDILSIPGFAIPSAKKLYGKIQSARGTTFDIALSSCGIPLIGSSKAKDICAKFSTFDSLEEEVTKNQGKNIAEIRGIGESVATSVCNYFKFLKDLVHYLDIQEPVEVVVAENQLTIVITGAFMHEGKKLSRKDIESYVLNKGHKVAGSVSKKTSYLLCGEASGSKLSKATELGIPVITDVTELYNIL